MWWSWIDSSDGWRVRWAWLSISDPYGFRLSDAYELADLFEQNDGA